MAASGPRSAGRFDLGSGALLGAGDQARWRPNGTANVIPPSIPRVSVARSGSLSGAPGPFAEPLAWGASYGTSREPSMEATASASSKQRADSSGSAAPETVPSIGKQESHYRSGYSRAASASVSPGVEMPSPRLGSIASQERDDSPAHHLAECDERESASVGGRRRAGSGSGSATSSLHAPPTFSDSGGPGLWQPAVHACHRPAEFPISRTVGHNPLHSGPAYGAASNQSSYSPVEAPRVPQLLAPGAAYSTGGAAVGGHSSSSASSSSSGFAARGDGIGIVAHGGSNGNAGSRHWDLIGAGRTGS